MNSQELLALSKYAESLNPYLDEILSRLNVGHELVFADTGLGPQHAFPIYGENGKPSGQWVFYLMEKGPKIWVCGSNPLPGDAAEDVVAAELNRCHKEFSNYLLREKSLKLPDVAGISETR